MVFPREGDRMMMIRRRRREKVKKGVRKTKMPRKHIG